MSTQKLNCPNCGAPAPDWIRPGKPVKCEHCDQKYKLSTDDDGQPVTVLIKKTSSTTIIAGGNVSIGGDVITDGDKITTNIGDAPAAPVAPMFPPGFPFGDDGAPDLDSGDDLIGGSGQTVRDIEINNRHIHFEDGVWTLDGQEVPEDDPELVALVARADAAAARAAQAGRDAAANAQARVNAVLDNLRKKGLLK